MVRGINHPVFNLESGKGEITSQNHGFAISMESLGQENIVLTHKNLNDNTVEGIRLKDRSCFSVQYHPGLQDHMTHVIYLISS